MAIPFVPSYEGRMTSYDVGDTRYMSNGGGNGEPKHFQLDRGAEQVYDRLRMMGVSVGHVNPDVFAKIVREAGDSAYSAGKSVSSAERGNLERKVCELRGHLKNFKAFEAHKEECNSKTALKTKKVVGHYYKKSLAR